MTWRALTLGMVSAALLALGGQAAAGDVSTVTEQSRTAAVQVEQGWVRGTVAGQKATGAFMQLRAQADSKLLGASSPVTSVVQIHTMQMADGVMRMREIPSLDLPAGKTVELKPGSYHIMLMNLAAPLAEGQTVPLTLKLQSADGKPFEQALTLPVRGLSASPMQHHDHSHHHAQGHTLG